MEKISFIGLGIMGKPMAKNLLKAGYALRVYDLNTAAVEEVASCGAVACSSVKEAVEGCGIIVTMLPNSPHVKAVALEEGGICDSAAPGSLLVDMSSIAPKASQEIHEVLAGKGIHMIDAPVSGGEPKAIDGTLAVMVGGTQEDFDRALPVLKVVGGSAVLVGSIGSGNTCKLANQVIVALNIAAVSEGMMLASLAGADPQKIFEAIRGGLAGSTVMENKCPMMFEQNYVPGFKIDLHIKDLNNAIETGYSVGAPLPLTAQVMQMFQRLHTDGEGQSDHSALVKYYEKLTGTEVGESF